MALIFTMASEEEVGRSYKENDSPFLAAEHFSGDNFAYVIAFMMAA